MLLVWFLKCNTFWLILCPPLGFPRGETGNNNGNKNLCFSLNQLTVRRQMSHFHSVSLVGPHHFIKTRFLSLGKPGF